jgi:hypothetical protein
MYKLNLTEYRIARLVDKLFGDFRYGENCRNPVTGAGYIHGVDPIGPQKEVARRALLAREWFALNGPADAQPLPLWCDAGKAPERERALLLYIVRLYARSLQGREYDVKEHPPFADYVSGVLWEAQRVDGDIGTIPTDDRVQLQKLKERFPPRELTGMGLGFRWLSPKLYAEIMPDYRRRLALDKQLAASVDIRTTHLTPISESVPIPESVRRAAALARSLYWQLEAYTQTEN